MNGFPRVFFGRFLARSIGAILLASFAFAPLTVLRGYCQQNPAVSPSPGQTASEISEHEQAATFQVRVNLVLVRVVVRDKGGRALEALRKEDFQLFDEGKTQTITKFSVEQRGSATPAPDAEAVDASVENKPAETPVSRPEHYIAFLFDDIHSRTADLIRARDAADAHLTSLLPSDRVAIFSTSGQTVVDFTDDRAKLRNGLLSLRTHPIGGIGQPECPDVSYYMADLIQNKNDPAALEVATEDALVCAFEGDPRQAAAARSMAQGAALRALSIGQDETRIALTNLNNVVQRLTSAPGQRTIILLSSGFLNFEQLQTESDIIDRAIRNNIIISAIDARGLYTVVPGGDASQATTVTSPFASSKKLTYQISDASAENDVLAEISYGTGGTFFHNNNDLKKGVEELTKTPDYYYVLGFAPQNLKYDGRYHKLKVLVTPAKDFNIQARRGYYAPRHVVDASEQAKQEIEEALFSQEVVQDLPVQLGTQFFKATDTSAKLAVIARIDVKRFHFQKVEGRNRNDVTVVSGIFDRNGKFIAGTEKILQLRLKDDTLENKLRSGVTMKTNFDVQPGSYLVRLVVRDAGGLMAEQNGVVEIP